MAKYKFTLSIGYPTATHEQVIDVCDVELSECETEEDKDDLVCSWWKDWSDNYIDGCYEKVED